MFICLFVPAQISEESVTATAALSCGNNSTAPAVVQSAASAIPAVTSTLQPISSQAPVIGEKYYFSKTPISNDVAKAAAETVMAIASSALSASKSSNMPVTAASAVTSKEISIIALDSKSEQPEITSSVVAATVPNAVTKPVTVLSFIDNKPGSRMSSVAPSVAAVITPTISMASTMPYSGSSAKIIDSTCLEHYPGSSSISIKEVVQLDQGPPGAELQAYLQAKAMKAATVRLPSIHEEPVHSGKD